MLDIENVVAVVPSSQFTSTAHGPLPPQASVNEPSATSLSTPAVAVWSDAGA